MAKKKTTKKSTRKTATKPTRKKKSTSKSREENDTQPETPTSRRPETPPSRYTPRPPPAPQIKVEPYKHMGSRIKKLVKDVGAKTVLLLGPLSLARLDGVEVTEIASDQAMELVGKFDLVVGKNCFYESLLRLGKAFMFISSLERTAPAFTEHGFKVFLNGPGGQLVAIKR
jgi:hypothetical protein